VDERRAPGALKADRRAEVASKRILVVDDSTTVRQQVSAALVQAGFEVVEACDGADGIEKLETDPEIGLVILDVNMPRMNGLEMLETVKAAGKHPALQIVMLTSEGQRSLVERAKKAGAKGWIVKPFKPEHMVATAKKLLAM
jgi:two-component system chemotaxis response regulator CheY